MTQAKYNELIEKIQNCLNTYKKTNYQTNKITLYLANGEALNIRFPKNGIAHLLGVNIEYLKLSNLFRKNMNTYECLEYFLENSYTFSKLIFHDNKLNTEEIFSKNIEEKLSSFWENIRIRSDDLIAVVKYDREKAYQSELPIDVSDYFIIRRKSGSYFVLGLKNNEEKGLAYVPTTSRRYEEYQEYDELMARIAYKQELTYINSEKIENEDKNYHQNFHTSKDVKTERTDHLINLGKKYSASVSVANDYLYFLRKNKIQIQEIEMNIEVLSLLKDAIKNGEVLDIEKLEIKTSIRPSITDLINLCNDIICSNNKNALISYSTVAEENKNLKEELCQLKQSILKIKEENNTLRNKLLDEEIIKETYQKQLNIYEEAYQKARKLTIPKNAEKN